MRNHSRLHTRVTLLATVLFALALLMVGNFSRSHAARPDSAPAKPANVLHTDDYQRSARLDTYRVVADIGAGRGENS